MTTKHSPMPWYIVGQNIVGPDGYICTWSGKTADAQLIAAAPETVEERDDLKVRNTELLSALDAIEFLVHGFYAPTDNDIVGPDLETQRKEVLSLIRQTITKAKGGT